MAALETNAEAKKKTNINRQQQATENEIAEKRKLLSDRINRFACIAAERRAGYCRLV